MLRAMARASLMRPCERCATSSRRTKGPVLRRYSTTAGATASTAIRSTWCITPATRPKEKPRRQAAAGFCVVVRQQSTRGQSIANNVRCGYLVGPISAFAGRCQGSRSRAGRARVQQVSDVPSATAATHAPYGSHPATRHSSRQAPTRLAPCPVIAIAPPPAGSGQALRAGECAPSDHRALS